MNLTSSSSSRTNYHPPHPHRGINNVNGTSCHTSSALQLLFHCFPKVTEALLLLAPISAEYYWIDKCTTAATQQERRHQNQLQNHIVKIDNQCGIDETQSYIEGLKNPISVVDRGTESIIPNQFVYQLSWFFHLLAYSEDMLQVTKEKAENAVMNLQQHQELQDTILKKMKKNRRMRKKKNNPILPSLDATIHDFKAKSRAGTLTRDDWELLVMKMKHNIQQHHVACSSDTMVLRNRNEGEKKNKSEHVTQDDVDPSTPANNQSANYNCSVGSSSSSIDPTTFYQYLSSYDANFTPIENNKTTRKNSSFSFNTNNVGDAAMVFRRLVGALETSVESELSRLQGVLDISERATRTDNPTVQNGDVSIGRISDGPSARQIHSILERIQLAMRHSWSGTLVSRIIGTHHSTTTTKISSSPSCTDEDDSNEPPTPAAMATTITWQRTKKNGNIERPLPVPFPLPVINKSNKSATSIVTSSSNHRTENPKNGNNYFQNLEHALHSVTIEPIPIRGYDWSDLLQRGDVIEEQFSTMEDNDEGKPEKACADDAEEYENEASRSIACQTDFFGCNTGTQTIFTEVDSPTEVCSINHQQQDKDNEASGSEKQYVDTTALPAEMFGVENSSCYAAAVAALALSNQSNSVASRHSHNRKPFLNRTDSAESRRGYPHQIDASVGTDDINLVIKNIILSGMEIGPLSDETHHIDTAKPGVISRTESLETKAKFPSDTSSSEEESSIDSHVSSVDTDEEEEEEERDGESFSTRSSAIETPPYLDDLSLGSFTDSEPDSDEKKDDENAVVHITAPAVNGTHDEAADRGESLEFSRKDDDIQCQNGCEVRQNSNVRTSTIDINDGTLPFNYSCDGVSTSKDEKENHKKMEAHSSTMSTAVIIDFNADDDTGTISYTTTTSSSFTSSSSSYSSSDDTSADSSRTTSDEASSSSSSVDDADGIGSPDQDKNAAGWITRKETRLRHPLPHSLVFHMKRFEYSASTGRVEKLMGVVDIPRELNVRACCSDTTPTSTSHHDTTTTRDNMNSCCYKYFLSGAIVHVDPQETDGEIGFGGVSEGHYVAFLHSPSSKATITNGIDPNDDANEEDVGVWTEVDDEMIRIVNTESDTATRGCHPALDAMCGCDKFNNSTNTSSSNTDRKVEECRYATMLVYSRACRCNEND